MSNVDRLIRKARASKSQDFALPIVETPADALRLARDVAAVLTTLPENQKLSLLSDLQEVSQALSARVARLGEEADQRQAELRKVQLGRRACDSYARNVVAFDPGRRG